MPAPEAGRTGRRAWAISLGLALGLSILYALPDLRAAFAGPYVVQNDARQHVFWMQRFTHPELFPHDPVADYFESVAPPGYRLLYHAAAAGGLDPMRVAKVLPVALGATAAAYAFAFAARLLGRPAAACLAALLLSQSVWLTDEVASGTPHAFAVPLLVPFLYYLSRRATVACAAALALQGLFYPQILLVSCGTLLLWLVRVENGRPRLTRDRRDLTLALVGLAAGLATLLPFALETSRYGPAITAAEARRLPEFLRGGRARFFDRTPWQFWMVAHRSGLMAKFFSAAGPTVYAGYPMLAGLLLPALVAARRRFPLATRVSADAGLLARLGLASVALFAAAHLVLFRLHLPSRYSMFSARVILALAGGAAWVILADTAWRALSGPGRGHRATRRALGGLATLVLLAFGLAPLFQEPGGGYVTGGEAELYRFLERRPPDTLVASLSPEADNLPSLAARPVLLSRLHAVPYQVGYYREIRRRALDLIRAEYASDPRELGEFIRAYGVDFIVLDRWSFRPRYLTQDSWVRQYRPLVDRLAVDLERGEKPALERLAAGCTALETERTIVVDARCLLERG